MAEWLWNGLETHENVVSLVGAIYLFLSVEVLYRLMPRSDFISRFGGIWLFTSFAIYMAEITVVHNEYKLYEGFLVLGSVEFVMSITLTVDIWICPFFVFLSHTYAFIRIYFHYDEVSGVLLPGLFCGLFHFTIS